MVLLTIIGEDISRGIPLFYSLRQDTIDHVLLCDDAEENVHRAQHLARGLRRFAASIDASWSVEVVYVDEDYGASIRAAARSAMTRQRQIALNISDTTAPLSAMLSSIVRDHGGIVISYDPFDNDVHLIDRHGRLETRQITDRITIAHYLTLLDYRIRSSASLETVRARRNIVEQLFAQEADFAHVRSQVLRRFFGQPFSTTDGYESTVDLLRSIGIVDRFDRLVPSQQKVLMGDLFEEYLFALIEALDPDDMMLGVQVDFDDPTNEPEPTRRVLNEFDILIAHRNRLFVIEAKYSDNLNGLEVVYKYDAILDHLGGATKAIIVNVSSKKPKYPYLDTYVSKNFSHSALRRARMAGMAVYHDDHLDPARFRHLVRSFFHIGDPHE
jgi:hypothetical protein